LVIAVPAASTALTNVVALVVKAVGVYAIAVYLTFKAATTTAFASTFVWAVAKRALLASARV
jgi:hypothetical protein